MIPPRVLAKLDNGVVVERSGKNGSLKVTDASGQRAGQSRATRRLMIFGAGGNEMKPRAEMDRP